MAAQNGFSPATTIGFPCGSTTSSLSIRRRHQSTDVVKHVCRARSADVRPLRGGGAGLVAKSALPIDAVVIPENADAANTVTLTDAACLTAKGSPRGAHTQSNTFKEINICHP